MTDSSLPPMKGLLMAIGYVVASWALIERQLDNCVGLIFHDCNGDSIRDDIPRSLNQKIIFLRKAFLTFEQLKPFEAWALELLREISCVSEKRHDFVHGTISKITPKSLEFERVEYSVRHHHVKHKRFSASAFPALSTSLRGLVTDTGRLHRRLRQTISQRPR